jgi:hypothetical protein
MKILLVNVFLSLFAGWFALLDRCLLSFAERPMSGELLVLILFQVSVFVLVMLLVNGAFPIGVAAAISGASTRLKISVFAVPLILFMISPVMISDSIYRARYGNINKFVVHAHVERDLACCLNPFSVPKP